MCGCPSAGAVPCALCPQTLKPDPCGPGLSFRPRLPLPNHRCWKAEVLRRITRHYKTGKPMPEDLIDKLVKSRLANGGAGGEGGAHGL